jgi:hypothetical protein
MGCLAAESKAVQAKSDIRGYYLKSIFSATFIKL